MFQTPFLGLIIFKLSEIPTGTTTTLPIIFASSQRSQSLTQVGGTNTTVADLSGEGIYLAFYDSETNTLQLV
jgi:hypothetical protein